MTLMEIFYPIILMLVCYLIKLAFDSTKVNWADEGTLDEYLIDKGNFAFDCEIYPHLTMFNELYKKGKYGNLDLIAALNNYIVNSSIIPGDKKSDIEQKIINILLNLSPGSGVWKYIDPLEETHDIYVNTIAGLPVKPLTMICYNRFVIALVGFKVNDDLGKYLKSYIDIEMTVLERKYSYKHFDSIDELNNYITSEGYGKEDKPAICFGIYFKDEGGDKYSASLHYFNDFIQHGIEDVPNNLLPLNEEMQQGPNMNDVKKYSDDGYIQIMNILANYMLQKKQPNGYINYGFAIQKYDSYKYNNFAEFVGVYYTFFAILSYLCPLILYVLKMVIEKESRSKEVMKIMGMGEGTYFLSYFVEYFIVNIIYAFVLGYLSHLAFKYIPYIYFVLYLWLFGLNIFALAFFCQSFMDSTRLALIVTCLIYCLMLFVSAAVYDKKIKKIYKIIAAFLPPVNLLLGAFTLGEFERMYYYFESKYINENYLNYSLSTCYIMFTADFFIYLFLGFYLQNVIPHEFGVAKPWYFIFLPSYWLRNCFNKKKNKINLSQEKSEKKTEENKDDKNIVDNNNEIPIERIIINDKNNNSNNSIFDDNPHKGEMDFQNEDLYQDRNKRNDVFMLRNVTKVYDDGKIACNKISFNLFRNEIFALLGRNGAGKTSLINVLIGMNVASSGNALYKEKDILEESNMNEFRNKLGICPQHDILFPKLTVREHLEMFCYFKGFDENKIKEEVDNTLKDFRIHDIENILAGTLSAGQRRKLSIAISIIGGSEVIFLDEPSSGMDITSRRNLWEILKKITEKKIIILTTHYMEEASALGNRIGIMAEGVLKCIGTPLFLIEKYGKYLSVNVYKENNANNDDIINFFKSKAEGIETEILTQEILIRIPKNKPFTEEKNINIETFFSDLDNNLKQLKIKNYSASMPTLEDVFLNIGSVHLEEEEMLQSGKTDEEKNERILFKQKYIKDFTKTEKFLFDIVALLKKRSFQILRDTKTFMLEIICPILLVLVGCIVVQIDIFKDSEPIHVNKDTLASFGKQVIYYGDINNIDINYNHNFKFIYTNVTTEFLYLDKIPTSPLTRAKDGLKSFLLKLYEKEKGNSNLNNYGALFTINSDFTHHKYDLIQIINGRARQSPMMFAYFFMNQILEKEGITLDFTHYPLPTTADNKSNSKALNNFCLVFFVSIAFSLIPANFISSIVLERINNSKHLMRMSGVSILAYWLINFLFELVKYYFTAGICLLILLIFGFIPKYFYLCYLLYGPPMIIITYFTSFFFNSEAIAQNFLILFNLVFGSLGSTVVILLRAIDKTTNVAKIVAYIIRIVPSFAFGYGYNLLLNGKLIMFIDYSINYLKKPDSTYISLEYAGSDTLFLGLSFFIYLLGLIIIEFNAYSLSQVDDGLLPQNEEIQDKEVKKEIKKANKLSENDMNELNKNIQLYPINDSQNENVNEKRNVNFKINDNNIKTKDKLYNSPKEIMNHNNYKGINKEDYSVRIKNIQKIYNTGCNIFSKPIIGVKNISFTVNYGECFGLLGLNGAGKTTIFKAITEEHALTHGSIYINGLNLIQNFDRLKLMFGYCPQFDAIFPYMSVYENLEFYSRIKGVDPEKLNEIIQAMIESMTLTKYKNKLAGQLSGGNKRKLSVAISMICNPTIVLLDEPSTGMDPEARRFMWAVIHKLTSKSDSNSVIMTTHSMDEAETLCRRMGIIVNGEFVCLGSSNYIKETYGYGYDINVRIKPFEQEKMNEILKNLGLKRYYKIKSLDEVKDILKKINKKNYCDYLEKEGIGRRIYHEVIVNGDINLQALINWSRYITCAMKMIKVVLPHFKEVFLSEFIENNFLFKIQKSPESKSIGFLFTLLEKEKDACEIIEYSIQPTSLEQIFNKFAENQGKTEEDIKNTVKVDNNIKIDDKLVHDLIL